MDFVVVGLGLGALGVLLGVLLAGVLAPLRERGADRAVAANQAARDGAIAAEQRETGRAALAAGVAVLVATSAALAAGLDDRTGAFLITSTVTIAAIGVLYWISLYRRRRPVPARPRRARPDNGAAQRDGPRAEAASPPLGNGRLPDPALLGIGQDSPARDDRDEDLPADPRPPEGDSGGSLALADLETARREAVLAIAPTAARPALAQTRTSQRNGASAGEDDADAAVAVGSPPDHVANENGARPDSGREEDEPDGP